MNKLILIALLSLAGCGEVTWSNPSMPQDKADLQFYECKAEGRRLLAQGSHNLSLAINATTECLQVHGFIRTVR